jgi:hypothetical protein
LLATPVGREHLERGEIVEIGKLDGSARIGIAWQNGPGYTNCFLVRKIA